MDQGAAAIIGVVVGSFLSMLWPALQWRQKGKSLGSVLRYEQKQAISKIDGRMNWLKMSAPEETFKEYPEKVVEINGQKLVLWQTDSIELPLEFWNEHCIELAGAISEKKFRSLSETADLIRQFEQKDADMLKAFNNSNVDQAKKMAAVCYRDLIKIQTDLHELNA
jgi:hypothetical protein